MSSLLLTALSITQLESVGVNIGTQGLNSGSWIFFPAPSSIVVFYNVRLKIGFKKISKKLGKHALIAWKVPGPWLHM